MFFIRCMRPSCVVAAIVYITLGAPLVSSYPNDVRDVNKFNGYLEKRYPHREPFIPTSPQACSGCLQKNRVGPMLVVYVSYRGAQPRVSLTAVKKMIYGPSVSFADVVNKSSYGQSTLNKSDVDILTLDANQHPDQWSFLNASNWIRNNADYKIFKAAAEQQHGMPFRHVVAITAGSDFAEWGEVRGDFSWLKGGAISWQTLARVIGHNWGLGNANAFDKNGFHSGFDFAIMGHQFVLAYQDYNAVARRNLGWIKDNETAVFPTVRAAYISALNQGPLTGKAYRLMTVPCRNCMSGNKAIGTIGGTLFISYRVSKISLYGVSKLLDGDKTFQLTQFKKPSKIIKLATAVHVHYQATDDTSSELWTTLSSKGDSYEIPFSSLYIYLCPSGSCYKCKMGYAAEVAVSNRSINDAKKQCSSPDPHTSTSTTTTGTSTTTSTTTYTTTTVTTTAIKMAAKPLTSTMYSTTVKTSKCTGIKCKNKRGNRTTRTTTTTTSTSTTSTMRLTFIQGSLLLSVDHALQLRTSLARRALANGIAASVMVDPIRVVISGVFIQNTSATPGRRLQVASPATLVYVIKTSPQDIHSNQIVAAWPYMKSNLTKALLAASIDVEVLGVVVNQPQDVKAVDPCGLAAISRFLDNGKVKSNDTGASHITPTFAGLALFCTLVVGMFVQKYNPSRRRCVVHNYVRVPHQDDSEMSLPKLLSGSESALE